MMPQPLLSITGLTTWFGSPQGTVRAVDDVSLTLDAGHTLGVVGESGSGKTQTFFSILGLSSGAPGVVAGRARFGTVDLLDGLERFVGPRGKDVHAWNRVHQQRLAPILGADAALLFQDPKRSLIPYWTIGRHFTDVLRRRPTEQRPADLLASLGFRDATRILTAYPHELSGGEAQRALLGITMAMQPRLLIADEPTTGLDTINQARVLEALRQAHDGQQLAMVLISHDLAVVDCMVDDIVVMFAGRVVERISASQLRTVPDSQLHPYTRALRASQRTRAAGHPISTEAYKTPLTRAPKGCAYHLRCALRPLLPVSTQQQCATEAPPEHIASPGRSQACWGQHV